MTKIEWLEWAKDAIETSKRKDEHQNNELNHAIRMINEVIKLIRIDEKK